MSSSIRLELTEDLKRFVAEHAEGNEAGFVESVLRQKMERDHRLDAIRHGVDRGIEEVEMGLSTTLRDQDVAAFTNEVKKRGRKRLRDLAA